MPASSPSSLHNFSAEAGETVPHAEVRHTFLLDLSDALQSLGDPVHIQGEACRLLGQHLQATRVVYAETNQNGLSVPGPQYTDGVPRIEGTFRFENFDARLPDRYRLGRPVVQQDVAGDPELTPDQKAAYAGLQVGAYIAAPLVKSGKAVARLAVQQRERRDWTIEDVLLVQETAERVWSALERAYAETALRQSEARLRALVTASSDIIYRMSADWSTMLSLEGQGVLADTQNPTGAWLTNYIHPDDQARVSAAVQQAVASRSKFELEHRVRLADGTLGWTLSRAVPVFDAQGRITEWFGAAADITARKRTEETLRENDERQAFLLRLSDMLRSVADPNKIKELATKALGQHLGLAGVGYADVEPDGDAVRAGGEYDDGRMPGIKGRFHLSDFGAGFGPALHAGKEVFSEDMLVDARGPAGGLALVQSLQLRAVAALPLVKNERLVGCLYATHPEPHSWPETERQIMRDVAERTWAAVERARAEEAEAADLRDTQLLSDLGARFFSETSEIQAIYEEVSAAARKLSSADASTVQILDPQTQQLVLLASHGFPEDSVARFGRVDAASATSCGVALISGERTFVDFNDPALDDPKGDLRWHVEAGYISAQSTPLITRSGRAIGMVSTHWRHRRRPSEREMRFLDLLARQAADLIEQWQSQQVLRASEEKYRTLFESIDEGFCLIEVMLDEKNSTCGYRLIEANPAFERNEEFSHALKRTVWDRPHGVDICGRIALTGNLERFELIAGVGEHFFDVSAFRIGEAEQRRVAILFDDITSRKQTEELLRQEADLDAFRVALNDALRSLTDPVEVQTAACRVLGVHVQASRALYAEVKSDDTGDYYVIYQDYCAPNVPTFVGRYQATAFGITFLDEIRAGHTVVITDVAIDSRLSAEERQAFEMSGIRACIGVPLLKDGQHMALITLQQSEPRMWTAADIAVVEETAERTWAALELARAQSALHSSEEQWRFIVNQTTAGIAQADVSGTITFANQKFGSITGYSEAELLGETMQSITHPEDAARDDELFVRLVQTGEPFDIEKRYVCKDGSVVWVHNSVSALHSAGGEIKAVLAVCVDISGRKRVEEALREAKENAELANQSKDRFLAVLSHELRTPLTPVLMTVDALQHNTALSPEIREDLAMMKRNIQLETKLIDDLLDISRITSGKLVLHLGAVDLNDIVRNVCRICTPLIRERGIELQIKLDRTGGVATADSARVQQVLWNVLMNAVKFTPANGSIHVSSTWLEGNRCQVRIQDNGVGIAPEVLPYIFNAFEQGGAGITRQFGGLGLGLAICKALMELHHGSIRAESAGPGQGATFIIELPGRAMTATTKIRLAAPAKVEQAGHLRLLVVEDHPDTERTLAILLRRAGFTVVTAPNVTKAIATASSQPFDVLVSDLGLPDGTGYDVMRNVHSILGIPGIAMSGYGMEEDLRRSREAGFSEHLVKPIDVPELISVIRRVAAKRVSPP